MPADWLTVDHVSAYLDLLPGEENADNLALSTAAVKAAVERRRSDLDLAAPETVVPDDVHGGAVMWAAQMYQWRNGGGNGSNPEAMPQDDLGTRRNEIMNLIGWRSPVAT